MNTVSNNITEHGLRKFARAEIQINKRDLREVRAELLDAFVDANEPPTLFVRDNRLCAVLTDEDGVVTTKEHDQYSLRSAAGEVADFFRLAAKDKIESCFLPLDVCKDILFGHQPHNGLPTLVGITASPVVTSDGVIEATPGYLNRSQLYLAPPEGNKFQFERLKPTLRNAELAKHALFGHLLDGFPFEDQASRANALAFALQPLVRPLISGPTPLYLVEAPTRATGKTLLVQTLGSITNPTSLATKAAPNSDDEWRKQITAALLEGSQHIWWDNVTGTVKSKALDNALTTERWADRILHTSNNVAIPNKATWVATANNAKLHGDLSSRAAYIRLDAGVESPELRGNFKCPNPHFEVATRRGYYLGLLLCLIEYWIQQGMPLYNGDTRSRYRSWISVMRGITDCIGVDGMYDNYAARSEASNPEEELFRAFIADWGNAYGTKAVAIRVLCDVAFGELDDHNKVVTTGPLLDVVAGVTTRSRPIKLGRLLSARVDQVHGSWRIVRGDLIDGNVTYRLAKA